MSQRTALILGSTGMVGGHLKTLLLQAPEYDKIRILVRGPQDSPSKKLEIHIIDFEELENHAHLFEVDDVFCCLGTTMKKAGSKEAFKKVDFDYPQRAAQLAKQAGAKQFLLISALGANPQSNTFYNRVKGETEEAVKSTEIGGVHIFRPSLLLDKRAENRFLEKLGIIFFKLTRWMWIGPLKKYKGIHAKIVAQAMYLTGINPQLGIHIHRNIEMLEMRIEGN